MMANKIVTYLRVSTQKQGKSGLGIDAQRAAVKQYADSHDCEIAAEFVEVESGKNNARPKLAEAMRTCRLTGATLVIAKLDRLSRDAGFLMNLDKSGIDFVAADMPGANRMTVGIMAVVAEEERRMISARTTAALAAAKKRGVVLGGYRGGSVSPEARKAAADACAAKANARKSDLVPVVREIIASGKNSIRAIGAELAARGILTSRGLTDWSNAAVSRLIACASA